MLDSPGLRGPAVRPGRSPRGVLRCCGWLAGVGLVLGSVAPASAQLTTVAIDPTASFLRVDATDTLATDAVAIDLALLGFAAGDYLLLREAGEYVTTLMGTDSTNGLIGVFSSSATLAAGSNLNRVTGAIDAGDDVFTAATSPGGNPTNIAEDFRIADTSIEVPPGATHLFVAVDDIFYGDNSDIDSDLRVIIQERPATLRSVDPRKTYLRIDPAEPLENLNSIPIKLEDVSIAAGDEILMLRLGDWAQSTGGADTETSMIAVFSGSSMILANENPNRIPGAIDAGNDVATPATATASLPTDIPEDFQVNDLEITVPAGATHLFVSVSDDEYATNADPDNDLEILLVPEPAHELMAIAALATLALLMRSEQRTDARRPHERRPRV